MRLGSPCRYGWAPSGKKAFGKAHGHWRTITMLGAIGLDGFRGFMTIDAATSSEVFRAFVQKELVPNLRNGDCVVMDNLSAHKDAKAIESIRLAGASVLFLPPYSPELNPIEKLWAKLKDRVRRRLTDTRELFDRAVASAMDTISHQNLSAWFQHAGYSIPEK